MYCTTRRKFKNIYYYSSNFNNLLTDHLLLLFPKPLNLYCINNHINFIFKHTFWISNRFGNYGYLQSLALIIQKIKNRSSIKTS